ncbi:M16 family metallopeptidase [Alteraurantiacibacter aquimixticola]|uniref:Insulinase family protein n=1 Tax=Alteraurantiacibacter aquimixticola TaxID=2489173 RepID=A0A4T3F313_9SPHN|nr:M16 family metallopeptidase [Alteraurantiacibacter aquimixticola]TIX50510.1 insulinase family protein [Alteraurantiacibacter aquimixticola]
MNIVSRALRFLLPATLLLPVPALAQEFCTVGIAGENDVPQYARPDDPWIYRGTDIPVDDQWLFGELPNGLRYAVRQNGVPPCQVSIRVRIDAGSLHEEDDELGYAHLIEHLLFRESRDFGPGEAIPHFQRMGAALGFDTNALTSATQTVYQLNLPNASRQRLEDSVRLFSGMIREPALSDENLAADVPVVLAERRERLSPAMRIAIATRELFYDGQRLANRAPMGTVEALQAATSGDVRAFHTRWYRPENTVVVMAGDAAPQVLAALVERHFGDWQVPGEVTPEPDFGDPVVPPGLDPANPVGETAVLVEPGQPRSVTYAVLRPWEQVVDNLEYNRGLLIDAVAQAIVNRRLEEQARAGGHYLYAVVEQEDVSRSADATFVSFAPLTEDWESAMTEVRAVIANALVQPPSEAEIEQAVAQFDVVFQDMVGQERIQAGSVLADNMVNAVDIREAVAAPETFLSVFRGMRDRFTPEAILEHTQRLFEGQVIRGLLLTPELGEATADELHAALAAPVDGTAIERDDGEAADFADLPPIGEAAAPVTREPLGPGIVQSTEKLTFANGVNALIRDSENEPGRVTVRVRFGAGWRGFADDEAVYALLGERALVGSGLGPLGQNEIDRLVAGRKIGFDFGIGEGVFQFEAMTRAEDLADQLYLFAAKLAMPRWDVAPVERAKASALLTYDSLGGDPMSVLNRDLQFLLRDRDPRFATPTPEQLRAATASKFREVWARQLAQGPVEVSVFGDIDPEATIDALSRTFGALPERQPLPAEVAARTLQFPAANAQPIVLRHDGDADQAAAIIAWPTGGGSAGLPQSRKLELLASLFGNRLLDAMREREGATYTPFSTSNWPVDVEDGGYMLALVQVRPEDVDTFFALSQQIAEDLATTGPTQDELARVVEPVQQNIFRAQTGHTFWLNRVAGGSFDPLRVANLPSLAVDYLATSGLEIQALAQRYLLGHGGLKVVVLPQDAPPR